MNIEEIEEQLKTYEMTTEEEITKEDILNITGSMFDTMLDYVDNSNNELEQLQQQNQKYKEVIDKAIEYIEKLNKIIPRFWFTKLLELLKEVE